MTQILPKCRQKAQSHRKGNRKTPGSTHPLQSSHELADAGGGNQIGTAGNAGEHQNEVGYRSKDRSQRAGQQRRRLMHLVDTQNLLREETSLASFTAGFKLAWGIARELEADGLYSFQKEEEQRACEIMEREVNGDG